jgi:hypothetical protein
MKKNFFLVAGVLMLILSFIAFSDNLITDVGQESNSDPKFIIHGLFCFAWFIIFVIQTNFIRKGNYSAHKKLGIIGVIVAAGVFISTLYIFIVIFESWEAMPFFAKANRFFMPTYALFIYLAYTYRTQSENHKRFMYVATLYMLGPILDRASEHLYLDVFIFNSVIWNGLFISLFVYDWLTIKKIHPISYIGFIWFYTVWSISIFT